MIGLIELLKKKNELLNNNEITDEMFYILDEKIGNIIANNYTIEEIKKCEEILRSDEE